MPAAKPWGMKLLLTVVLAAVVLASMTTSEAGASVPESCGPGQPTRAYSGTFDTSLEGAYVLVPFEVPEAATSVRVRLCHDQPPSPTSGRIRHTLDLGLYDGTDDGAFDEDEFRGWGGSSRLDVIVTPERATNGFAPGPIPAGEWAAELGVAAVSGPEEGDPDSTVAWRLEIFLGADPSDADMRGSRLSTTLHRRAPSPVGTRATSTCTRSIPTARRCVRPSTTRSRRDQTVRDWTSSPCPIT